jgi:hypothetical protein
VTVTIGTAVDAPDFVTALYLAKGYTPLDDPSLPSEEDGAHPFEKRLVYESAV